MVEIRIEELNEEITKAYNAVAEEEKFIGTTSKSKALLKKAQKIVIDKQSLDEKFQALFSF